MLSNWNKLGNKAAALTFLFIYLNQLEGKQDEITLHAKRSWKMNQIDIITHQLEQFVNSQNINYWDNLTEQLLF